MKKLYFVGGTMGVGKTATCQILKKKLPKSVFLDGDWCWDADPFTVTEETKEMVVDNICHLLGNFLACSAYENIIFCWVMHEQGIIDGILERLDTASAEVFSVSLIATSEALAKRLEKDIENGVRQPDIIERSIARIPMYSELDTLKIDVSNITPDEAAQAIIKFTENKNER